jgi:hypothetical protein
MSDSDGIFAPLVWRVRAVGREWGMQPGDVLTFGRGCDRDIRFGHSPEDDFVSNEAGSLIAEAERVLVRNDSRTQGIYLYPLPGPVKNIGPGDVAGTSHEKLQVIVPGGYSATYTIHLAIAGLPEPRRLGPPARAVPRATDRLPTRPGRWISHGERVLLAALCEPLLLYAGPQAVPATYQQAAKRAGVVKQTVRNALDKLRERLTSEGIPGLGREGDDDAVPGADYRAALARWAVESLTITSDDLRLLPRAADRGRDGHRCHAPAPAS